MELDGFGNRIPGSPNTSESEEDLTLSIKGVRTQLSDTSDEYILELNTTRGVIKGYLRACEGKTAFVIFVGGAGGTVSGPADKVYEKIGISLVEHGISSLRIEYRKPGDFAYFEVNGKSKHTTGTTEPTTVQEVATELSQSDWKDKFDEMDDWYTKNVKEKEGLEQMLI